MKNYLILILYILTSCKSYKDYSNQKYELIEKGKQTFKNNNNDLILEISVNNYNGNFLFDTGASGSIITDSLFLNKITTQNNLKKTQSLSNASGFKLDAFKIKIEEIKSSIFDSKNIIFSYYKIKNIENTQNCIKKNNINNQIGIIGLNNFINSDKTVSLNFDDNTIEILNENCSKNGYIETKGKIKLLNKKIIFPITLNNKKIEFLFDTGNNGNLFIEEKEFSKFTPDFEGEMIIGNFNGYTTQKIKIYKNVIVTDFYTPIENQNITSFKPFKTNTMGMKFISKFNWLIDFKNKKVYIQKNQNYFETKITQANNIQVIIINQKLIIGFKSKEVKNYNLGDEIISVNNKNITNENICEVHDLLNSNTNWDNLKIEMKK